ncbi:N-acetyltransferase family protein [Galbitalea sp. SE-J8]|uniref:GNAT family N-acetyltransferase n=1 Tax=Galbitalea sp. SE-J8 TaxID=3054952 RepID=UPI00259D1088|nr:GNAT family N-acetyltransferase [Galbitalea sp. SE-J8]MDM4763858.1 N-acetyltransferase family protein [Galbitalea sp. SE-J8]
MRLRDAEERDLDAILAIHNRAIRESTALWTDDEVPRADREEWFARQAEDGSPILVAEVDGDVAGYASYAQWRSKHGYRFSVEDSIYLADGHRGRGYGRVLLTELIDRATAAGHHVMLADIEAGNVASIGLHESLGFVRSGLLPQIGFKFGRWLDLAILTRTLA